MLIRNHFIVYIQKEGKIKLSQVLVYSVIEKSDFKRAIKESIMIVLIRNFQDLTGLTVFKSSKHRS